MQMMGGIFLWIQALIMVLILILAIQKFIRYFGKPGSQKSPFHSSHHAILFLGIFSFVWGMFTQLVGIVQALNAIIEAADVSPELVLMGLKNSFVSPVIGLSTMLLSALVWAILHVKYTMAEKKRA